MVKQNETDDDRRGIHDGFIPYSVAKREGVRAGSMFEIEGQAGCMFRAGEYVSFRPDINREFKGFWFDEL